MNSSNRNERDRNRKEINEANRYSAAHNGLVAGSRKQHTSLLSSNGPSTVDNDQWQFVLRENRPLPLRCSHKANTRLAQLEHSPCEHREAGASAFNSACARWSLLDDLSVHTSCTRRLLIY
jgi:hypothetical protein